MNDLPRRDDEHLTLTTPDEAPASEDGVIHSADGLPRDERGHVIGVWHVAAMNIALGEEPDARVWASRHALTGPLAERAIALGFGLCAGEGTDDEIVTPD